MDFDESLFEDFESRKKIQENQCPYKVMTKESGWFLSPDIDTRSEQTQPSYILKYKADYLYGQSECEKALECYKQLLQLVPVTNIMLYHEVKESMVICLKKMGKHNEALDVIKELIRTNNTDSSLWLLLSSIYRGINDIQGAIFALQCCIQHNSEVANYWVELAKGYAYLSGCCGNFNDLQSNSLPSEDKNQRTLSANDISQTGLDVQRHNQQEHSTPDKELSNDNRSVVEKGIVAKIDEMTLDKPRTDDHSSLKDCNSKNILNENLMDNMNQYVQNHHSCFCALCSLVIARYLYHKYSFHLSPLQSKKRKESILKVSEMINRVNCASSMTAEATKKYLHEKFSMSVNQSRPENPTETDKMTDIFGQNVNEKIQDFEKHWFPLL